VPNFLFLVGDYLMLKLADFCSRFWKLFLYALTLKRKVGNCAFGAATARVNVFLRKSNCLGIVVS
jgi:hypothetical protein